MKPKTFVIVGLGFIGGSLAFDIRRRFPSAHVIGVSRSTRKLALAKKRGLIHEGFAHLRQAFSPKSLARKSPRRGVDFVFICSPVDTIPSLVSQVNRYAQPDTLVTDVGSTKREITRCVDRMHFRRIQFVGSHPLAGSHLAGMEHAREGLFDGAFVFLTPTRKSHPRAIRTVSSFWKTLRASVCVLSPELHDRIVSQISHLPHAVASILMHLVSSEALRYGATGFLDTTRVAQGDPRLWAPIFLTNRKNLLRDLRQFQEALRKLMGFLEKRSEKSLVVFLKAASLKRSNIRRRSFTQKRTAFWGL